jgi:hypothetical protein
MPYYSALLASITAPVGNSHIRFYPRFSLRWVLLLAIITYVGIAQVLFHCRIVIRCSASRGVSSARHEVTPVIRLPLRSLLIFRRRRMCDMIQLRPISGVW